MVTIKKSKLPKNIKKYMIQEAYCSKEVSELLKEKGFDELCIFYYKDGVLMINPFFKGRNSYQTDTYSAPTHQMAMKWLREEKNIIVNVWYNGVDWDAEYYNNEDENFYPITDSSCNSYEEAVEEALKYVLENLI